jgi:hypothetical protein
MQDLQNLEIFALHTLNTLNRIRVLDKLYFGGGTMLRLCHNLNRYSVDLDFWIEPSMNSKELFTKIKKEFSIHYTIKDAANKYHTLIYEIQYDKSNRNLVIEIRKEQSDFAWERKIAFSKFTNLQIAVKGLTLKQMMKNKLNALLSRKLIRDCFDIEFLLFKGIELDIDSTKLAGLLAIIENYKDKDYKVILGSLLDQKDRQFYLANRFKFLKEEIRKKLKEIEHG